MTTPIAVECFSKVLAELKVPEGFLATFKAELAQVLRDGLEFPPGLELPLRFAQDRRRFIESLVLPVPNLPDVLPRLENLYQSATPGERKSILQRVDHKRAASATPTAGQYQETG